MLELWIVAIVWIREEAPVCDVGEFSVVLAAEKLRSFVVGEMVHAVVNEDEAGGRVWKVVSDGCHLCNR